MMGLSNNADGYIFDLIKKMWAENGDILSQQYTGTGSTITSVTKSGKQGIMGKVEQMKIGVARFWNNTLEDDFKHECIKMIINQHPKQYNYGIKATIDKRLKEYKPQF